MFTHKKALKYGLVLLVALMLLFAAGCGGKVEPGSPSSGPDNRPASSEKEGPGILEKLFETETPKSASELFAEGLRKSLVEAMDKSGQISSASFNLLLSPGVQADNHLWGHTESGILITNASEPDKTSSVVTRADFDAKTGDTSMTISIKGGGETVNTGGIYFFDHYLLVQKADVEEPMIRHKLDPSVANSYKSLPALERFMRLLSEPSKPKMSDSEWLSAIDAYLQTVSAIAGDKNYASEKQDSTFAGIDESCTAITLTLSGQNAADTASGLVELISLDPSLKALFVSHDKTDEDTYGVTGMDGLLRDLGSLTPDEIDAMDLTFKILLGDNSCGLYMNAAVGGKSASLLLRFFELGHARQIDMAFSGFDGGGVKLNEMNSSEGGDNYSGQIIYQDISPGGGVHEYAEMITKSTIAGDSYTAKLEIRYNMASDGDADPVDVSGSYDYSQLTSGQSIVGESTGSSVLDSGDGPNSFSVSVTINQGEGAASPSAPQFIEGSGISTSDPAALYAALSANLTQESYNNTPLSMKLVLTLISMLI